MISLDGLLLGKEGFSIDLLIMSITDGDNSELLRFHTSASSVRSQAKSKAGTRECETQDLLRSSFRYFTHTVMHFVVQYRALTHLFNLFSFFVNVGKKSGTHMYFNYVMEIVKRSEVEICECVGIPMLLSKAICRTMNNMILYSLLFIINNFWHQFRKLQHTNKSDNMEFSDSILLFSYILSINLLLPVMLFHIKSQLNKSEIYQRRHLIIPDYLSCSL